MPSERTASPDAQYQALRAGSGFVPLPAWSSISLTGADRQKFLHNFCTNDIKRLQPGDSCEAFFTNVKGKIIGHGFVAARDSELTIVGPPDQGEALVAHLDRYLIREDVQLRDTSHERSYVLITGDTPTPPVTAPPIACTIISGGAWGSSAANAPVRSERLIELTTDEVDGFIRTLEGAGAVLANDAFPIARIEAGFPLFGIDFDDTNLPQEIDRDRQAISFTKGCYLGQETVARIDALGHVNQKIAGVRFDGNQIPEPGTELSQKGATVGRVTSACFSPKLAAPLALAMLRRDANAIGTLLESPAGNGQVVALPI
jgi:folate-binding protein YgfZ